jgi:dienelactone hydrolase
MFHVKHAVLTLALVALPAGATGTKVGIPSSGVELAGFLFEPKGKGPFPAVVMLHGCGGMLDKSGKPTKSYVFWAENFQRLGYSALLLDSFGARGLKEICTHKQRSITPQKDRSKDAHAALAWLAKRKGIDADRIHLIGWSNGAMTVLHAIKPDAAGRDNGVKGFRSAVAFYPGCTTLAKESDYKPVSPLLIQAGAADNWTPAKPCEELVKIAKSNKAPAEIDVYPEAYHSFDKLGSEIRERPEVRNANNPTGWGATVGTNEKARTASIQRTTEFIQRLNK